MATVYLSEPDKQYGEGNPDRWHRKYENVTFRGWQTISCPVWDRDYVPYVRDTGESGYEWRDTMTHEIIACPVLEGLDPTDLPYKFFRYDEDSRLIPVRSRTYYSRGTHAEAPDGRYWMSRSPLGDDMSCLEIHIDADDPLDADIRFMSCIELTNECFQIVPTMNGVRYSGRMPWPPEWMKGLTLWEVLRRKDREQKHNLYSFQSGSAFSRIATNPVRRQNVRDELRLGDLKPVALRETSRFGDFFDDDAITAPVNVPFLDGQHCMTLGLTDDLSGYNRRFTHEGYGVLAKDSDGEDIPVWWAQSFKSHTSSVKIARAVDGFRFVFFLFNRMLCRPTNVMSEANFADGFIVTSVHVPYSELRQPERRKTWAGLGRQLCNTINEVHGLAMAMTNALNTVRGRVAKWGGKVGGLDAINRTDKLEKLPKTMTFMLGDHVSVKETIRARAPRDKIEQKASKWWSKVAADLRDSGGMLFSLDTPEETFAVPTTPARVLEL